MKKEIQPKEIKYLPETLGAGGETDKQLMPNSNNTVQPVALMRLGVFVPVSKKLRGQIETHTLDVSEVMGSLSYAKSEGFKQVTLTGQRLNMDTDFKIWIGIIRAFSEYGLSTNKIQLRFTEFASMCGYDSSALRKTLRQTFDQSLVRIRGNTIRFSNDKKTYVTGLIKTGFVDFGEDIVEIEADERLWELFQFDNKVLLQLHVIKALPNKEAAQALYLFIESLPPKPLPLSFMRLRRRLNLASEVKSQNRTIKDGINELVKIGYLKADIVTKGRENMILIHERNPKLKPK